MPQLIVDESLPRDAVEWLLKKGFDLIRVSQTPLKGTKDLAIAQFALKNHLAIITMDKDFSQIYRTFKKDKITVIIIRAKPATPENIIETLNIAQQKIDLKEIRNKLIIISKKRIRIVT